MDKKVNTMFTGTVLPIVSGAELAAVRVGSVDSLRRRGLSSPLLLLLLPDTEN